MIIYKATNLLSGRVYIGQTKKTLEKRKAQHYKYKGDGPFHKALKFYHPQNFKWDIIDTAKTQEELNFKEELWINIFQSLYPSGYNLRTGGGGWELTPFSIENMCKAAKARMTPDRKSQISNSLKGNIPWNKGLKGIYSNETRDKMGGSTRGKTFTHKVTRTQEHKDKLSKAAQGKRHSQETKELCRKAAYLRKTIVTPGGWNKGIPLSDQAKELISKANTGRVITEETRLKLSISKKGHVVSDDTREKLRAAAIKQHQKRR